MAKSRCRFDPVDTLALGSGGRSFPSGAFDTLRKALRLRWAETALACLWLMILAGTSTRAEIVYDNYGNSLVSFVARQEEYGDEIRFAGSARIVNAMTFEIVGERDLSPDARAVFRVYRNNGPIPPSPDPAIPTPGELLYQSNPISILPGIQNIRIEDIEIPVPTAVVWTVEFSGTSPATGSRAGMQVYFPPTVGRTFRDYWVRDPDGFRLYLLDGGLPAAFGARFEAIPDPPVTVEATLNPSGHAQLIVTGPIGSEHVVETSVDASHWSTLGLANLAVTNTVVFVDASPSESLRFYRTRSVPHPGRSVILRNLERTTDGTQRLHLEGPIGSETVLEFSSNGSQWRTLDILQFGDSTLVYEHADPGTGPLGLYRTRRPTSFSPLYRIRKVERQPDGSVLLSATGQPGLQGVTVEGTSDYLTWSPVGTIRFDTREATFTDATAPASGRIYRLRR